MEKIAKNLQLLLMCIILVSTVIAVGIEIYKMFENRSVTLADLLLMFLYLEVLAMVRVFLEPAIYKYYITITYSYYSTSTIYYFTRKRNGSKCLSI